MFITADALVCHAIGDYVLQSNWMAQSKTSKNSAALAHVVMYTVPFLALTTSWKQLAFIAATHFVIDRWRLARYVCWAKNFLAPKWIETRIWVCDYCYEVVSARQEKVTWVCTSCERGCMFNEKKMVRNFPWSDCKGTGYDASTPPFMAVWLMILADNIMHVILNAVALNWIR